jgi:hypothetical protein
MNKRNTSFRGGFHSNPVPKGFSSITELLEEDVFIVGYPKSGNTWFQNLVAGVVYGVDSRLSPPLLANDLVPDVHATEIYRRYATPTFFKSHHLPVRSYRRVIYLLRDGRDAMVSYLHFLEAIHNKKLDFQGLVETGLSLSSCKWHEHVQAWDRNPYQADLLVIRYENLVEHPLEELQRFCTFIGLDRDEGHLSAVAEAASFRNLRAKEIRLGMGQPDRWPSNKFFFRRGKVGSYLDEMPQSVLEAFLRDAAPTLEQFGYSIAAEPEAIPTAARSEQWEI